MEPDKRTCDILMPSPLCKGKAVLSICVGLECGRNRARHPCEHVAFHITHSAHFFISIIIFLVSSLCCSIKLFLSQPMDFSSDFAFRPTGGVVGSKKLRGSE